MERVTEHVLTETAKRGCNPSLVVTSAGVVVIDTPQLPTEAVTLRQDAEALGNIEFLFNTEHHPDHIFGNYYFRGAGTVVHHQGIYDNFMLPDPDFDYFDLVAESVRSKDPAGLAIFPEREVYYKDMNRGTVTFTGDLTVRLGDHTFELLHTPGHTPGQTAVFVPEERVVFTGDTIFSACQTWLMDSNIDQWLIALDRIAALDVDHVIPGHGPVTTLKYVSTQRATLYEWVSEVAEAVAKGWSREETMARVNPGAKLPVDVGLEFLSEHIRTKNAASLWDKLSAPSAARP